jgi:putative ABC transport system permease protein
MLLRLLRKSIRGRAAHAALASGAVMVAATLVSALLNVALDVSENMAAELRAFGANILVVPKHDAVEVEVGGLRYAAPVQAAYLEESDLGLLKTIFWGHNIVGLTPFLSGPVEIGDARALLVGTWFDHVVPLGMAKTPGDRWQARADAAEFHTGLRTVAPWWQIEGAWIADASTEALVGGELAKRLRVTVGDVVKMRAEHATREFRVQGVVHTGGPPADSGRPEMREGRGRRDRRRSAADPRASPRPAPLPGSRVRAYRRGRAARPAADGPRAASLRAPPFDSVDSQSFCCRRTRL